MKGKLGRVKDQKQIKKGRKEWNLPDSCLQSASKLQLFFTLSRFSMLWETGEMCQVLFLSPYFNLFFCREAPVFSTLSRFSMLRQTGEMSNRFFFFLPILTYFFVLNDINVPLGNVAQTIFSLHCHDHWIFRVLMCRHLVPVTSY